MARFFREDFDRSDDFVVVREFTFNGERQVSGQALDKALFTPRRLRQLYDMRNIGYRPVPSAGTPRFSLDRPLPPPPPPSASEGAI